MFNKLSFLGKNNNKALYTVLSAGLLALVVVAGTVAADGPSFNIFPVAYTGAQNTDFPLLDGRNITKGTKTSWSQSQSEHDATIAADPGDTLEFLIYYHNGTPDTPQNTATSVVASANVPGSSASQFTISSSISASNAASVSSSDVNRGGNVQVSVTGVLPQTLALVSGSTVWLPNRATETHTMPDSIASGGVNLGDIRGCWNFAGFVKFRVQVSNNLPTYSMTITKQVRNDTVGGSYGNTANANPGETMQFQIVTTNTSQAQVTNVIVADVLPARLTFIPGTLTSTKTPQSGDLFSGGLNIGTLQQNESVTITFKAQVADASQFSVGQTTLINAAAVSAISGSGVVGPFSASANVIVTKQAPSVCTISVRAMLNGSTWPSSGTSALNYSISGSTPISDSVVPKDFNNQTPGTYIASYTSGGPSNASFSSISPSSSGNCPASGTLTFTFLFIQNSFNLTLTKQVKNVTTGTSFGSSTNAQPSQQVQYSIVVTNTSNVNATNVNVRDSLPNNLTFTNGTLSINGVASSDSANFFGSNGITFSSLAVNETRTIVFNADIAGQNNFAVGNTTLTNTAYASATSVSQMQASADIIVNKTAPQKENGNPATRP